jgi:UDP-N-acetylglucosamine 2-epimerase (non-hydrolysing)
MKHITIVAGARPNFIKIAPIIHAINKINKDNNTISYSLVHTGQHYDKNMSGNFFEDLQIPKPNINLEAGGGSQSEQTAAIMIGFEKYLNNNPTDLVIVVGDVTSTMACSIVAKKQHIKVAHVEAGIRSNDVKMPEEINRIVTDSITDYFFTTSVTANNNLKRLGISEDKIFFVGNTMIDTLIKHRSNFKKPKLWDDIGLHKREYVVLTLHRPSNVDSKDNLKHILDETLKNSSDYPVIFPVHPRTSNVLNQINYSSSKLHLIQPLSYLEFNYLVDRCKVVITDSGGITEETTVMGIPCITLRDSTERPETVELGTNVLIGTDPKRLERPMKDVFSNNWKKGSIPENWDGESADRIIKIIVNL